MDLWKEILYKRRSEELRNDLLVTPEGKMKEIVESQCYQALQKIKAVLKDDSLTDPECFWKIEEIVTIFEQLGSNGGGRHDFG